MGEHKDRMMERWVVAPPAGPLLVTPLTTDGAEHIATHDGRAHARRAIGEESVVEPLVTAILSDHLSPAIRKRSPEA